MSIWIARNGQSFGPYPVEQLVAWLAEGKVSQSDQAWKQGQAWRPLGDVLRDEGQVIPPPPPHAQPQPVFYQAQPVSGDHAEAAIVRRIADYERVSGILWIILGAFQCISLVGIVAGVWNIFAGISRVRAVPTILARDPSVPSMFESVAGLIIIGVINLLLGGVIGVVFVIFDFIIRDMAMTNRHLFERKLPAPAAATDTQGAV
jgi:hypothetical protein